MIKFQKFQDEEGNVEFVEHLVVNSSGESNEVYSKEDASRWRSLNYFQKVSVWLMILIVFLMFSLLVAVCMKADHSHRNEHVEEKDPTTPGVPSGMRIKQGSPTTRTTSSPIVSQRVVSLLMGYSFEKAYLEKPISDMRPSYKTTRKIPGLNDILFKKSTSTDTSVESKKTVDTEDVHVNTATIFTSTPSADKRTTVDNETIEVLQDRTTTGFKEYTNKSVHDADDTIGKQTSPETVFLIKSSKKKPSTTGKNTTEMSQNKSAVRVPCDKEHAKNSLDADDGGSRGISPGRF